MKLFVWIWVNDDATPFHEFISATSLKAAEKKAVESLKDRPDYVKESIEPDGKYSYLVEVPSRDSF